MVNTALSEGTMEIILVDPVVLKGRIFDGLLGALEGSQTAHYYSFPAPTFQEYPLPCALLFYQLTSAHFRET